MTPRIATKYICVVDLEATCWERKLLPGPDGVMVHVPKPEIIEIGAVLLPMNGPVPVSEFQTFVKPKKSPVLSDFCRGLTTISQADVDGAPGFAEARDIWFNWLSGFGASSILLASWGLYDYRQLYRDCQEHGVVFPLRGDHLNLKEHVAFKMGWGRRGAGQAKALNRLGITQEGTVHRGIDDARMAAKILKKVGDDWSDGHGYRATARDVMMADMRNGG